MILQDGAGSGRQAVVNSKQELTTRSYTKPHEQHINENENEAYSLSIEATPTAAGDCFAYLLNSNTVPLIIKRLRLAVDTGADEVFVCVGNAGTRNAAGAIVPANLNVASGHTAEGTFEQGVDLDGGAATLTAGTEVDRVILPANAASQTVEYPQGIVLQPNQAMTLWADVGTNIINVAVFFHYNIS